MCGTEHETDRGRFVDSYTCNECVAKHGRAFDVLEALAVLQISPRNPTILSEYHRSPEEGETLQDVLKEALAAEAIKNQKSSAAAKSAVASAASTTEDELNRAILDETSKILAITMPATEKLSTKKKAPAVTAAEKPVAKKKRKSSPLPPELANLTKKDLADKIVIAEEFDTKKKKEEDSGPFNVASKVKLHQSDGTVKLFDLNEGLTVDQLRSFSKNVGVRSVGSLTKFQIRKQIALIISMGAAYSSSNILNPTMTGSEESRTSAHLRLINTVFLPEYLPNFQKTIQASRGQSAAAVDCCSCLLLCSQGNHLTAWQRER